MCKQKSQKMIKIQIQTYLIKVHEKKNKRHNSKSTGTGVTDENKKTKKNISENKPTVLAEKIYKVTCENEIVLYN